MNDKIAKCKSITYGIQSIGSYKVPVNPIVASKLYNDVCIPTLCYGSEVLEIIKSSINEMEKLHCQTAKMIQGLPSQSSNTASLVTMGWHSVQVQHCSRPCQLPQLTHHNKLKPHWASA